MSRHETDISTAYWRMPDLSLAWQFLLLVPVVIGSGYLIIAAGVIVAFSRRRGQLPEGWSANWPPVSLLRPICGVEKNLAANLRSGCQQNYPDYHVVLSMQRLDDPALPIVREIEREFGPDRVSVTVADSEPEVNGRVQNLLIALGGARHDTLVVSDSDMLLRPDFLTTIVAPLADPTVGCSCTLYRAVGADTWFERLELLTVNAEFNVNLIFAVATGLTMACMGGSTALRRSVLESIGGWESLSEYMVDDFELGRRIEAKGLEIAIAPYFVDTIIDLSSPADWWQHLVYLDQNTWLAQPVGFLATIFARAVPFALVFAAFRLFDAVGLLVLAAVLAIRLGATAVILLRGLDDREGLRSLALLPLRDLAALASWVVAITKRTFMWRGYEFRLASGGRIVPRRISP